MPEWNFNFRDSVTQPTWYQQPNPMVYASVTFANRGHGFWQLKSQLDSLQRRKHYIGNDSRSWDKWCRSPMCKQAVQCPYLGIPGMTKCTHKLATAVCHPNRGWHLVHSVFWQGILFHKQFYTNANYADLSGTQICRLPRKYNENVPKANRMAERQQREMALQVCCHRGLWTCI